MDLFIYAFILNVQADGWIVEKISLLENPNQVRPKRFWGVYTKLKIFNMTDYKKGILVIIEIMELLGYLHCNLLATMTYTCSYIP